MDGDLKDILINYKECTLQIMKIIEDDNLDSLEELIEKRQGLVDKALSITAEKEEGKEVYKELKLDEIQDQLNTLMLGKLELIRNEMQKISKSKVANNLYNKVYNNAAIFSKKI